VGPSIALPDKWRLLERTAAGSALSAGDEAGDAVDLVLQRQASNSTRKNGDDLSIIAPEPVRLKPG
jgi:hypothetical protein